MSNAKLFSVGDFDFRLQHLLIIGILAIAVSTSAMLRAMPASHGYALMEFDPWFNYRATEYLVENGFEAYFEWHDEKSWYPHGRDVSLNSQVGLHVITATLYNIFGGNSSLYDFTVLFPLVIGSLTSIVVFAFVRVIGGTTAGLIASLMFAISLPIIVRGMIGWYKSEPLGLFFGFLAVYLLLSAIKNNKGKTTMIKLIFGGLFLTLGLASWGGIQFLTLPLSAFFISLPFFKKDNQFLFWAIPIFSASVLSTVLLFERPGIDFIVGYGGLLILGSTIFLVVTLIVQRFSNPAIRIRNSIIVLGIFVASGIAVLSSGFGAPSFRYLNAVNPFMSSTDALTTSVAEHTATNITELYSHLSVFIIFGLIGAWLLFSDRAKNSNHSIQNEMKVFALVFGLCGLYVSSAFIRLELFASVALIILGSIGLTILLQKILQKRNVAIKFIFCIVIIGLVLVPIVYPSGEAWSNIPGFIKPTILTGATHSQVISDDWFHATSWMKDHTPTDSVIFAWWDYGYWIQTLGERATLIDNSTLADQQIEKVARTFMSPVENAWVILNSTPDTDVSEHYVVIPVDYTEDDTSALYADYVLINLAGIRYETETVPIYDLHGGGDESKKQWFLAISGINPYDYMEQDAFTPTPDLIQNTFYGNLIPFSIVSYYDPGTERQFKEYQPNTVALWAKDIKFNDPDGPFTLVYASPSFSEQNAGWFHSVLIYKVNHEYTQ
jgi:dolichyl-diphosphooligosaccharide--protein glycosyltransferase